jgi:hypothetical protein
MGGRQNVAPGLGTGGQDRGNSTRAPNDFLSGVQLMPIIQRRKDLVAAGVDVTNMSDQDMWGYQDDELGITPAEGDMFTNSYLTRKNMAKAQSRNKGRGVV